MAKVNPPIAALQGLNLPKPLLDFLNQLWLRSGGLDDFIESLDFSANAEDSRKFTELRQLSKKVKQLEITIEDLRTENAVLRKQLAPKDSEFLNLNPVIKRLEKRLESLELE